MDVNHHLRSIILKLENRLSDNDRRRLHFFLGNDVPRRIRDDPSLSGTLSLMESLIDQDKINEQDFTFLIHAFDEIQCLDAVKLLREHMRQIQSHQIHESIQSLATVMPPATDLSVEAQEDDKYAAGIPLIHHQYPSDNSINVTSVNNQNVPSMIQIVGGHSSQLDEKKFSKRLSTDRKYLLFIIFLLLLVVVVAAPATMVSIRSDQLSEELKMKEKIIIEQKMSNNKIINQLNYVQSTGNKSTEEFIDQQQQSMVKQNKQNKIIEELTNQLRQLVEKQTENNRTIFELRNLRLGDNQILQNLNQSLQQSFDEQIENNQKIQQLDDQLQQSQKEKIALNKTIQRITKQCQQSPSKTTGSTSSIEITSEICVPDTSGDKACGCPDISECRQNCKSKFCGIDARCTGFLGFACECLIGGVWQSKASQC